MCAATVGTYWFTHPTMNRADSIYGKVNPEWHNCPSGWKACWFEEQDEEIRHLVPRRTHFRRTRAQQIKELLSRINGDGRGYWF